MEFKFSNRISGVQGSAIREIFKYGNRPEVISLAGGNPAPELFPAKEFSDILADILAKKPTEALQYGVTEGYAPLRAYVRKFISERENIGRDFDDTIIVSGGQQGIDLATKVLVNEGDVVIVEEPSFIGALNAFRAYGAKLVGVPVKDDGMDMEALEKSLSENANVKIIYTIPTFQNPSGVTMSEEKRKKLYALAKKYGVIVIEDNPYGELTFDGSKIPTIKSIDDEGIVLYSGSFSKILTPGIRVGYITGHRDLIAKMIIAKQVSDVHTPMLTQMMSYEFLTRYDLSAHIEKLRALYGKRCKTMLDAIDEYFPQTASRTSPKGGLFVWCDLNDGTDTAPLAKECVQKNVLFVPGSTFMVDMNAPTSTMRLNYSSMTEDRIVEGVKLLGNAIKESELSK